ncbi:MAG: glycosyltransferase family 9 protein [Janthinobacterium lividum]
MFSEDQSIAFVMSPRLGDALISMVVVANLQRNGYRVDVFSDHLAALRDWFPGFQIHLSVAPGDPTHVLEPYDVLLHAYRSDVVVGARDASRVQVMDEWPTYRQVKPMVEIQQDLCRHELRLAAVSPDNGLQIPASVRPAMHERRIVIHPTASAPHKEWLPARFSRLVQALQADDWEPRLIMTPAERDAWRGVVEPSLFAPTKSLDEVSRYLCESAWMIGNDSGLAHLASNLGTPTVTLAIRRTVATRWRPGWAPSEVVFPPPLIPSRALKDIFWKYLIPTHRVLSAFALLRAKAPHERRYHSGFSANHVRNVRP